MPSLLDEISRLETELHHPGVPCSRERLEQLLHPGFHEVGRSGRPYSRDTVIGYLASVKVAPAVESWDFALEELGEGCVLLTFKSAQRAEDGSLLEAALRSSIWRRTPQGWQLYYHQGTPAFTAA